MKKKKPPNKPHKRKQPLDIFKQSHQTSRGETQSHNVKWYELGGARQIQRVETKSHHDERETKKEKGKKG